MDYIQTMFLFCFILGLFGWIAFAVQSYGYNRRITDLENRLSRAMRDNRQKRETERRG